MVSCLISQKYYFAQNVVDLDWEHGLAIAECVVKNVTQMTQGKYLWDIREFYGLNVDEGWDINWSFG